MPPALSQRQKSPRNLTQSLRRRRLLPCNYSGLMHRRKNVQMPEVRAIPSERCIISMTSILDPLAGNGDAIYTASKRALKAPHEPSGLLERLRFWRLTRPPTSQAKCSLWTEACYALLRLRAWTTLWPDRDRRLIMRPSAFVKALRNRVVEAAHRARGSEQLCH